MIVHEPLTLATDYVLTVLSVVFGILLWRHGNRSWALAFGLTASASFFGGTFHGFGGEGLWKATVYSIGFASMFLTWGAARSRGIRATAVAILAVYAIWMVNHDEYIYAILDYGIALLFVCETQVAAWVRNRASSAPWIIGSVAASIAAAGVQQAPVAHHNDLYHLIQMIALWLLYSGGTRMSPDGDSSSTLKASV